MIDDEYTAELVSKEPRLSITQARLFLLLWEAKGRVVTYARIEDNVPLDHCADLSPAARVALVKRLRRVLKAADWPVTIKAHYCLGYSLTAPTDWEP